MEVKTQSREEDQVLALMKEDLPEYLQNILLACGYDKISAITEINVCTDLDKMLDYITENSTDHPM